MKYLYYKYLHKVRRQWFLRFYYKEPTYNEIKFLKDNNLVTSRGVKKYTDTFILANQIYKALNNKIDHEEVMQLTAKQMKCPRERVRACLVNALYRQYGFSKPVGISSIYD